MHLWSVFICIWLIIFAWYNYQPIFLFLKKCFKGDAHTLWYCKWNKWYMVIVWIPNFKYIFTHIQTASTWKISFFIEKVKRQYLRKVFKVRKHIHVPEWVYSDNRTVSWSFLDVEQRMAELIAVCMQEVYGPWAKERETKYPMTSYSPVSRAVKSQA